METYSSQVLKLGGHSLTKSDEYICPRTRIKATVRPYNAGGATTEYIIPTATSLIRPGFMSAACAAGTSNIFTAAGVATDGSLKMN